MKWSIVNNIIIIVILSFFLLGCEVTPLGYSIYNKVAMEEPSKFTFAYDAGNYKYTYLNGTEVKVTLLGTEIPLSNRCEQLWKMKGITFAQENIVERNIKVKTIKDNEVYASYEGEDIGLMIIKEGYAKASPINHSKYNEYIAGEEYAKKSRNGIWACK